MIKSSTFMRWNRLLEHALFAGIAMLSVAFHENLHWRWFFVFLAALLLIEAVDWLTRHVSVRFKALGNVGRIDGVWAQGFCNSNESTPLGSYVEIENAEDSFIVRGTSYTSRGTDGLILPNDFRGKGFELDGNRLLYQFRGTENAREKPGIGYFEFTPADKSGPARYQGSFTDETTGEIRTVVGQKLDGDGNLQQQVLEWAKQNPACGRRPLGQIGVVDGYWLERIFDRDGTQIAGSALKINRSIKGYSIEGLSCDERGNEFGSFRGEGLECVGNRLVFYFDGISATGERHGVGYQLFIGSSDTVAATEFAGYFLETEDKKLFTLKGRRVPESLLERFNRDKTALLLDWLHDRISLAV